MGLRPEELNLTASVSGELLCQKKYPLPFTTDRTASRAKLGGRTNASVPMWNIVRAGGMNGSGNDRFTVEGTAAFATQLFLFC